MKLKIVVFSAMCLASLAFALNHDIISHQPYSIKIPHPTNQKTPENADLLSSKGGANNQYWLYTRRNPSNAQIIVHGDINTIWSSNYIFHESIKMIVHGWNNDGNSPINALITSAFLAVQDANVIVVDWGSVSNSNYTSASTGALSVGEFLGNFLTWLMEATGLNWNQVHLVGFSLGAHIVGIAGRYTGGRPGRITGLDPAGPQWDNNPNALNSNCAQYVECIHTDGGTFGNFDPRCDVDFYPNGGKSQPGCVDNSCSHGRSFELFASTVRYDHLIGRQCCSIWEARLSECSGPPLKMGNNIISKKGKGMYGLITGSIWPFNPNDKS